LTEQLRHANALLQAQIKILDARLAHLQAMNQQRLAMLEEQIRDHETRIRTATEGVTQFKPSDNRKVKKQPEEKPSYGPIKVNKSNRKRSIMITTYLTLNPFPERKGL